MANFSKHSEGVDFEQGRASSRKALIFLLGASPIGTMCSGVRAAQSGEKLSVAGGFCRCLNQWATAKVACFVVRIKVIEMTTNVRIM